MRKGHQKVAFFLMSALCTEPGAVATALTCLKLLYRFWLSAVAIAPGSEILNC